MAKKNKSNSLGIHRRKRLLRICHGIGFREAPGWSNREIIYALADARRIDIGVEHQKNADTVLTWFERNEPETFATKPPKRPKPHAQNFSKRAEKEEFYRSWEWRTLRMEVLKEHGFRCQCCGSGRGDTTMAGEPVRICVDHIKPLSKYWELRLERANLQVLCDECNQGKGAWDETDHRTSHLAH